jgi:phenylpyruvate tautomerase PptA (4-oxalocrotonate tautomerase family)
MGPDRRAQERERAAARAAEAAKRAEAERITEEVQAMAGASLSSLNVIITVQG